MQGLLLNQHGSQQSMLVLKTKLNTVHCRVDPKSHKGCQSFSLNNYKADHASLA